MSHGCTSTTARLAECQDNGRLQARYRLTVTSRSSEQPGVFYGWVIVAVVFVTLMVTAGLGFYNASVILVAARTELGASVSVVSFGPTLFFGIAGLTGFVMSRWMDRIDLRRFYILGGIGGALSLMSLRWVDSVPKLYLFFALFGVSFALAGLVPGVTLVARWFARRRSVALSIASTGLSVGGIAITPIAARLIDDRTLAGAGPTMAVGWLLGVVPLALLLRSYPADKGLQPDGEPTPLDPIEPTGATFAAARATRFFRLLAVAYGLVFLAQVGALAQMVSLVSERTERPTGAAALSVLAFSSVIGRLAGGVIVTKVPARNLTAVLILVQAGALSFLAVADVRLTIFIAAAMFGLSVGNLLMLQPLLLVEAFGVKHYSQIYSYSQLIGTIGVASGPFLLGALRDLVDYRFSLLVAAATNVVAFALVIAGGSVEAAQLESKTS